MFDPRVTISFNKLPKLTAQMEVRLEAVIAKGALDIEGNAKANVVRMGAVDTGFLLNSIQASKVGDAHWRVSVGAHYGVYINYGTWKMPARPFFSQAIGTVEPVLREAVRQVVEL